MRLTLFIDPERRMLVGGLNDPSPAELPELMQGDTVDVVLQGVEKQAQTAAQYYRAVPISFSTIKVAITGGADVPPTDGTIRLALVGGTADDVTPPFVPGITKSALQTLLNALPTVITKGGVKVLTTNAATNIFRVRWNDPAETALFAFRENLLEPTSDTRSYTVALPNGQMQLLKYRQLPFAFTDQFALPVAPVVTTASVRTGTNARNCIQSITVPRTAVGSVHFTFAGLGTAVLPVAALSASTIAGALNDLYDDEAARFSVTLSSNNVYYVEFVGPLALTDFPVLDATMHDQMPLDTPTGRLPLNGATLEMAFDGTAKIDRILEVEITDGGGEVGTPIQTPVTLRNDVIDSGMALAVDPNWVVPADPTYPPYDPQGATISAPGAYITPIGSGVGQGTAGTSFVVQHNLHTQNCIVEVRETGGTRHRLPDNNYITTYLNDDQIQVDFFTPPTEGQYQIIIAAVIPAALALPHHTHPISDVNGLQTALDNLGNGASTAPISENRLPAHIPWFTLDSQGKPTTTLRFDKFLPDALLGDNIPRLVDGRLQTKNLPLGVPYYNPGPPPSIQIDLPDGTSITLLQLDTTQDPPVWALPVGILPNPANWPGLTAAILAALQGGAKVDNLMAFIIENIDAQFPPAFALANHCPNDKAANSTPSSILPAIIGSVNGGTISDGLPLATEGSVVNHRYTVDGKANAQATIFRERQDFKHGQAIASNGVHWYAVDVVGNVAYPAEYNRELFALVVTDDMLVKGSRFEVDFTVQLQLKSPDQVRGMYVLRLEIGTPQGATGTGIGTNLSAVNWYSTIIQENIYLSGATAAHRFGYAVARATDTGLLTATMRKYVAGNLAASLPNSPTFAVRATLKNFDLEDALPNPKGQIILKMANATASIVKGNS